MQPNQIITLLQNQRDYFSSGQTKSITFRKEQLKKLHKAIIQFEDEIAEALFTDLNKAKEEAFVTETSIVIQEIKQHLKHIDAWAARKQVRAPLALFPASAEILCEPLGVALILSPWNYPLQLALNPLVGAISAGCCAILKPSPETPTVWKVIQKLVQETFPPEYITVVPGEIEVAKLLLQQRFDIIFFTGSPSTGKVVMRAAAEHLTPVILELGGKSPCIVDIGSNLKIAAKRVAWGKIINAGQTCIAPDYVFVHEDIKDAFMKEISDAFDNMLAEMNKYKYPYPKLVHDRAFQRVQKLLQSGEIVYGGEADEAQRMIRPTILEANASSNLWKEEIFGPLLPFKTFSSIDAVINEINTGEKPLALYYFGKEKIGEYVLNKTSSGGACINDTLLHIGVHDMPFGGVGNSGMGKYHGEYSFKAFSNERSIVRTPTSLDLPFRYPPFKYFKWLKRIIS